MSFINSLFKNSELSFIKRKLVLLYLLNVADIIFTMFLIDTGEFVELNFIMAPLVTNNQLLSLAIKTIIPSILLIWIFHRMRRATTRQLFHSNIIISGCISFYGLIDILHIFWCVLYKIA